jgi:hypothetical protein
MSFASRAFSQYSVYFIGVAMLARLLEAELEVVDAAG